LSRSSDRSILLVRNLRRASQVAFLGLFLALFFVAAGDGLEIFFDLEPFAAMVTLLSTGRLLSGLAWGLVAVGLTIVLGRAFCGWLCPMGTLVQLVAHLRRWKTSLIIRRNRSGSHQRVKYWLLAFFVAAAVMGSSVAGWLDPIAFLVRGLAEGVMPALARLVMASADLVGLVPVYPFDMVPTAASIVLGRWLLAPEGLVSSASLLTLALFVTALALAAWMPRLHCRVLCPLGAMLGLLGRWSLLGLDQDHDACTHCGKCVERCEGGCDPEPGEGRRWKPHECILCLNCQAACPEDALAFRFFPVTRHAGVDPGRRALLASAAAGAAFVPAVRAGLHGDDRPHPRRIRPPGSLPEEHFAERCIRCGTCSKVCPTNVIQPAITQSGLEGIYTPVLVPRAGFCEAPCVDCTDVCPTGAIAPLTLEEKGWETESPQVKLGTAAIDRGRCLPWANRTPCIVCEEHCPTASKAIRLEEVEAVDFDGAPIKLKRPHVDLDACVGCGACEYVCPVASRPAIQVLAFGESREGGEIPGKLSM
jgi:ferredoxin